MKDKTKAPTIMTDTYKLLALQNMIRMRHPNSCPTCGGGPSDHIAAVYCQGPFYGSTWNIQEQANRQVEEAKLAVQCARTALQQAEINAAHIASGKAIR